MRVKEDRVHKEALTQLIANSEAEMNAILFTDYFPYRKKNAILSEKINYNSKVYPIIQQFLQNCRLLQIAVLTDKRVITTKCGLANGLGEREGDCRSGGIWLRSDCQYSENRKPSELPA